MQTRRKKQQAISGSKSQPSKPVKELVNKKRMVCDFKNFKREYNLQKRRKVQEDKNPVSDDVFRKDVNNRSYDNEQSSSSGQKAREATGDFNCADPLKSPTDAKDVVVKNQTKNFHVGGNKPGKFKEPLEFIREERENLVSKNADNNDNFNNAGEKESSDEVETNIKPFQCSFCGKRFQFVNNLAAHSRYHTVNKPTKGSKVLDNPMPDDVRERSGSISDLSKSSQVESTIDNGSKALRSNARNVNVSKDRFQAFLAKCKDQMFEDKRSSQNQLKCDICGKSYLRLLTLQKHIITHNGSKKHHQCAGCRKEFDNGRLFKSHLKSDGCEMPYECTVCGKRFATEPSLSRHSAVHLEENSFQCNLCGKGFKRSSHLRTHLRVHTGEKPYECAICKKGFALLHHLQRHQRIHTGEKPFKCNFCEKVFNQSSTLKEHLRIQNGEKPFKCNVCCQSFTRSGSLKSHLRIHTGERPFNCKSCGKGYTSSSSLNKHLRIHT